MARTSTGGRMPTGNYDLSFSSASSITLTKVAGNDFAGLTAMTCVARIKMLSVVNGGFILGFPTSSGGVRQIDFKNSNTTNPTFRLNLVSGNVDVTTYSYTLNQWIVVAIRYTGSVAEVWIDGVKIFSQSASFTFPNPTTNNYYINTASQNPTQSSCACSLYRLWLSSLSDPNLALAMKNDYSTGAAINLDFSIGSGVPVDRANGTAVTSLGTPVWESMPTRSSATRSTKITRTTLA